MNMIFRKKIVGFMYVPMTAAGDKPTGNPDSGRTGMRAVNLGERYGKGLSRSRRQEQRCRRLYQLPGSSVFGEKGIVFCFQLLYNN